MNDDCMICRGYVDKSKTHGETDIGHEIEEVESGIIDFVPTSDRILYICENCLNRLAVRATSGGDVTVVLSASVAERLANYKEWRSKVPRFLGKPEYTDSGLIGDLLAELGW
jgi:hypothetical protein